MSIGGARLSGGTKNQSRHIVEETVGDVNPSEETRRGRPTQVSGHTAASTEAGVMGCGE